MPPIARPWFRMYSDVLDNIKVESLSDKQFRFWVKLLALSNVCTPRGLLPSPATIAFRTRMPRLAVLKLLGELAIEGLIDDDLTMHDWDEWQKDSDARTTEGRQKRGELAADAPRNGRGCAADAPPRVERDIEEEKEREPEPEGEDPTLLRVLRLRKEWENRVGVVPPIGENDFKTYARKVPEDWFMEAIDVTATEADHPSWKFCASVLKRCYENQTPPRGQRREAQSLSVAGVLASRATRRR